MLKCGSKPFKSTISNKFESKKAKVFPLTTEKVPQLIFNKAWPC